MKRVRYAVAVVLVCTAAAAMWALVYVSYSLTIGAAHTLEILNGGQ